MIPSLASHGALPDLGFNVAYETAHTLDQWATRHVAFNRYSSPYCARRPTLWCRRASEDVMADLTRVVIDCDTGVDDTMAVFYGLLSPNIDVVGLSCVWGNIGVDLTTTNTLRLLEMVSRTEIPVAKGANKPLVYPAWPPGVGVHGADGQ